MMTRSKAKNMVCKDAKHESNGDCKKGDFRILENDDLTKVSSKPRCVSATYAKVHVSTHLGFE